MNNPIAVVFHDPLGRFTVPKVAVEPAIPGLCAITLEQCHVTFLYPDGTEIGYTEADAERYKTLVTEGTPDAWWDDRPSCPYLTALTKLPIVPGTFGELMRRWLVAAEEAKGKSKHQGVPGQRSEFDLTYVDSSEPFESEWGVSYRHEFCHNENKFIWWTGKQLDIIPGETRRVKATVKRHDWHKGTAVTELSRVSPLKGERKLTKGAESDEPSV